MATKENSKIVTSTPAVETKSPVTEPSKPTASGTADSKPEQPQAKKFKALAKKHATPVQFEISNKTSLSDLSKRFNPATPTPEASLPQKRSSYFEKLDIATRLELDHSVSHTIDVQPDLRSYEIYILIIIIIIIMRKAVLTLVNQHPLQLFTYP